MVRVWDSEERRDVDLRVLIYTYHPEPWKWVLPRDGEHESRERREVVAREGMLIMRQHLSQAQHSGAAQYVFSE